MGKNRLLLQTVIVLFTITINYFFFVQVQLYLKHYKNLLILFVSDKRFPSYLTKLTYTGHNSAIISYFRTQSIKFKTKVLDRTNCCFHLYFWILILINASSDRTFCLGWTLKVWNYITFIHVAAIRTTTWQSIISLFCKPIQNLYRYFNCHWK